MVDIKNILVLVETSREFGCGVIEGILIIAK